jgi:hypothetical protein
MYADAMPCTSLVGGGPNRIHRTSGLSDYCITIIAGLGLPFDCARAKNRPTETLKLVRRFVIIASPGLSSRTNVPRSEGGRHDGAVARRWCRRLAPAQAAAREKHLARVVWMPSAAMMPVRCHQAHQSHRALLRPPRRSARHPRSPASAAAALSPASPKPEDDLSANE